MDMTFSDSACGTSLDQRLPLEFGAWERNRGTYEGLLNRVDVVWGLGDVWSEHENNL